MSIMARDLCLRLCNKCKNVEKKSRKTLLEKDKNEILDSTKGMNALWWVKRIKNLQNLRVLQYFFLILIYNPIIFFKIDWSILYIIINFKRFSITNCVISSKFFI